MTVPSLRADGAERSPRWAIIRLLVRTPPLLADLPWEDVERLLSAARRRTFPRGQAIFHQGDLGAALHLIVTGRVMATVTSRYGQQLAFAIMGPDEFFGELALLDPESVRTATIAALEDTETLSIRRVEFETLRQRHPGVNEVLVRILATRVTRLSDRLQQALYLGVETRVRACLVQVAEHYGGPLPGTVIPLTQEHLAGLAGTARATVNRVLRQEEEAGSLKLGRGRVTLIDPKSLVRRAELG
jgi:CRP/FNR family transcriptional regulator, cyclic AMP receptor protein